MVCLLCGDHRGIGGEHEVNARVWHQIGLELGDIHVQGTIEAEGGLRSETQVHLHCKIEIQNTELKNITSVIASFNVIKQEAVKDEMICAINLLRLV